MCFGNMGWGWGGGIMMLFWLLIIVAVVYYMVKSAQTVRANGNQPETALDILKKRYARGEISKAEYEDRKKDLI